MALALLEPDWPAPSGVRAAFTLRGGGVSHAPYDSLNLALHVGDRREAVLENRRRVREELALPSEPLWLSQVHGTRVVAVGREPGAAEPPQADGAVTTARGRVLAVLVADCLPVLLARADGTAIAVAHAGWRGLAAGVIEAAVAALAAPPGTLRAWLGPAIGAAYFEVGAEVRETFMRHAVIAEAAFVPNARGRWQCDLRALAAQRLVSAGVSALHGEPRCTYGEPGRFYSHRRDRGTSGRMAALLWLEASSGA